MLRFTASRKKIIRGLIAAMFLAAILVFADLFVLSRSAALIFNHAMAEQTMLRGDGREAACERLRGGAL